MNQQRLFRLLWLSVAAAVAPISLKTTAWLLTGSVGMLSGRRVRGQPRRGGGGDRGAALGDQAGRRGARSSGSTSWMRRSRFANWRVCMIQWAGSQKTKFWIAWTSRGRADV